MQRVGILAIQGDVEAHARALERVGAEPRPVLRDKDLDGLSAEDLAAVEVDAAALSELREALAARSQVLPCAQSVTTKWGAHPGVA